VDNLKFGCALCNTIITRQLNELLDSNLLDENDGKSYIPVGSYLLGKGILSNIPDEKIIINIDDMVNTKNHSNASRLNGCCGLDGLDGINTVCINDHEIGTKHSDCWMPHYVALEPTSVKWINE
jgi:hypothetical protein